MRVTRMKRIFKVRRNNRRWNWRGVKQKKKKKKRKRSDVFLLKNIIKNVAKLCKEDCSTIVELIFPKSTISESEMDFISDIYSILRVWWAIGSTTEPSIKLISTENRRHRTWLKRKKKKEKRNRSAHFFLFFSFQIINCRSSINSNRTRIYKF